MHRDGASCAMWEQSRLQIGAAAGAVVIHPAELSINARRGRGVRACCRLASTAHAGRIGLRLRFGSSIDGGGAASDRFAVLLDPTDRYMIYDEFRDEPAAIGGHVLIGLSRAWAMALGRRLNDLAAAGAFARQR